MCNTNYGTGNSLRCEIEYGDLMVLSGASPNSTVSTFSTITSTVISTESQHVGYVVPSGAIAGIAVGAAGFGILAALAFYFLRRKWRNKQDNGNDNTSNNDSVDNVDMKDYGQHVQHISQDSTEAQGHIPHFEIVSTGQPRELPPDRSPGELHA